MMFLRSSGVLSFGEGDDVGEQQVAVNRVLGEASPI